MQTLHPGLTSIRFLLLEIKRVFFFIYFTDFFILYFFIQNAYADKTVFKKNGLQIMFNESNCDRKSQLSGILTEPLNPRGYNTGLNLRFKVLILRVTG